MDEKKLIKKGLWSTCYRQGETFVKRYNYYIPEAAFREANASEAAEKAKLLTPHHHNIYKTDDVLENSFDFYEMCPIKKTDWLNESCLSLGIMEILNRFQTIEWDARDQYWNESLLKDFFNALTYLRTDISGYVTFLEKLNCETFIHGDFTIDNIGIFHNQIIVYDFQHGSYGPIGWDKSYIMTCVEGEELHTGLLSDEEKKMAEVISAIRLGRALRKSADNIEQRKKIFESWRRIATE